MKFHGFPVGMTERLQENRLKNSREWYNAQKEQFKKEIYEPFYALIEDMTEPMLSIDPRMCLVPRTCVSRIVRDTRRTKDKTTLYRDNLWCFFRRSPKTEPNAPAFYFEFFPMNNENFFLQTKNASLLKAFLTLYKIYLYYCLFAIFN